MAPTKFSYAPLLHSSSFRLLRLKGRRRLFSNVDDAIEVEIFETSLDGHPTYEAISYTWDQQPIGQPLSCNGQTLQVTANAVTVLKALRLTGSDRMVWLDAICIDQSSVADKNCQVPKMGRIYRQAQRALIWLGGATYETNAAFDYLRDIAQITQLTLPEPQKKGRIRSRKSQFDGKRCPIF